MTGCFIRECICIAKQQQQQQQQQNSENKQFINKNSKKINK